MSTERPEDMNIWKTPGKPSRFDVALGVLFLISVSLVLALCSQSMSRQNWLIAVVSTVIAVLIFAISKKRLAYLVGTLLFLAIRLFVSLFSPGNYRKWQFAVGVVICLGVSTLIVKWQTAS